MEAASARPAVIAAEIRYPGGKISTPRRNSIPSQKCKSVDRWEQGFAALSKFRRRKGHCCPPQDHVEGKFKLGSWTIVQRYRKDDLSVERKKRLDRIDFVWNWRDFAWEQGYAALLKFKRREGHCRVPFRHHEGKYWLGSWVSVQRRKQNVMLPKRRARLKRSAFYGKRRGAVTLIGGNPAAHGETVGRYLDRPERGEAACRHGWRWRIFDFIQCREPQSSSAS